MLSVKILKHDMAIEPSDVEPRRVAELHNHSWFCQLQSLLKLVLSNVREEHKDQEARTRGWKECGLSVWIRSHKSFCCNVVPLNARDYLEPSIMFLFHH